MKLLYHNLDFDLANSTATQVCLHLTLKQKNKEKVNEKRLNNKIVHGYIIKVEVSKFNEQIEY